MGGFPAVRSRKRGASGSEYGFGVGMVGVAALFALLASGDQIDGLLGAAKNDIGQAVDAAIGSDGGGGSVPFANADPIAADDIGSAMSGQLVRLNVLANDNDPDGNALSILEIVTGPASAASIVIEDGQIAYTSNPGFVGEDRFTYRISDGAGATSTAEVVVEVEALSIAKGQSFAGGSCAESVCDGIDDLILAPSHEGRITWGYDSRDSGIGRYFDGMYVDPNFDGMRNTIQYASRYDAPAPEACLDKVVVEDGKTYDDWYLPASQEMEFLFTTRALNTTREHWSSTEGHLGVPIWFTRFHDDGLAGRGSQLGYDGMYVHCVRRTPDTP